MAILIEGENKEKDESECLDDEEQEIRDLFTGDNCIEDKQEVDVVVDDTDQKPLENDMQMEVGGKYNAEEEMTKDSEGEEYAVEDTKKEKKEVIKNLTSVPEEAENGGIEVKVVIPLT